LLIVPVGLVATAVARSTRLSRTARVVAVFGLLAISTIGAVALVLALRTP
jgi:hypothetical protein